ncbi:MAG TPA: serine hydrolase, partial [Clostridia bacterium]|nr:serine hydrolase [Clostridia bacterium]
IQPIDLKNLDELNASIAGFQAGESVRFRDLFYGLLLSSGADAANALARETSGSVADFVRFMNESAQTLGLTNTHFANTTGLFHIDNYATSKDMVTLLHAAWEKPMVKEAMKTRHYTSQATPTHPQGIDMVHSIALYSAHTGIDSSLIDGGKTGQLKEAGYCLASFKEIDDVVLFLCTTGAFEESEHIADHVAIYTAFLDQVAESDDYLFTAIGEPAPTQSASPLETTTDHPDDEVTQGSPGFAVTVIAAVILGILLLLAFALVLSMLIKQRMEKDNEKKK